MNLLAQTHLNRNWEFIETAREGSGEWMPAEVPGHVHMDLVRAGVIGHPFERMQELGAQWVDQTGWSYRCRWEWAPMEGVDKCVLRFEGLDTVCAVSLNGKTIASSDNMHVPLEIEVSAALVEGTNELRVDFQPAARIGEERKAAYFAEQCLGPDTTTFPERSFVRKAQYMFGWDWGPRLVSCGIWKPVSLIEYSSRIVDVWARPEARADGSYVVHVQSDTEGPGTLHHVLFDGDGDIVGQIEGDGDVAVAGPHLWWSHDLGEPYLYALNTYLECDGLILDAREGTPVGLRTIRLVQEEDEWGTSFQFELNGQRVWARGANWIPDHSFPSQIDGRQYRLQLERAVAMNMNMLRVWGGGLYEAEAFYRAANELGVLVWQDCAYGCSAVPDTGEWLNVARVETEANVRRLRNHPSLAHWCGNNENLVMWHSAWGGKEHRPPRYYGEKIYDEVIPEVLSRLDPDRPYTPSSPWGGEHCNDDRIGDQHNWSVWHGGDWPAYTDSHGRFVSEFGFACSPSMDVWRKSIAPEDWSHDSAVVRWHDKTGKGYETFQKYVRNHYRPAQSLEEWAYTSQLNQRDALRHGIEHYRRSEFCKGTLVWQLNDCWPVQSWALIDSEGRWKAAAHEMRRLYADDLVTLSRSGSMVQVHVVHDGRGYTYESTSLRLFAVHTLSGDVLNEWEATVSLKPGQRKLGLEADVAGLPTAETILYAVWADRHEAWRLLGEPKDAKLPRAALTLRVADDGSVELASDLPVVDLTLEGPDGSQPLFESLVTLPMGGSTTLSFVVGARLTTLTARSLAGVHPLEIVRGPF